MGQAPADVPPVQDGIEATSNVDGGTHISLVEKSVGSPEGGIPNLDFAGPNDPANPQNWSKIYKSTHLALVSYMAFIVQVTPSFRFTSTLLTISKVPRRRLFRSKSSSASG